MSLNDDDANDLITCVVVDGESGAGIVSALEETNLAGGVPDDIELHVHLVVVP